MCSSDLEDPAEWAYSGTGSTRGVLRNVGELDWSIGAPGVTVEVDPGPGTSAYASARYDAQVDGEAELQWQVEDGHYQARWSLPTPHGRRTLHSEGRAGPAGLAPLRFGDRHRGEAAAHFDAAAGRIRFSGNQPDAPLQPGAQDRLSVLLQLGALIAGNPSAYPKGKQVTMQTATVRDAEIWHFSVEGEEELQLPAGHQRTVKLLRLPRREFDQKVELWLAPGLDYVPVRLRLTQPDGDWLEQLWSGTDRN